ncbi:MAG: hypothetical protein DHS20C15_26690 [Planctomycetota bacterium]|nr:MAG: hypothetical protein DHS20C15_26690 [Planctomycetota bacterium]
MRYRKILILGAARSGRSWLARSLAEVTGIRCWDPGAQGVDAAHVRAEARAEATWILEEHVAAPDREAFDEADLVVLLRTPLWLRALRSARGYLRGERRVSAATAPTEGRASPNSDPLTLAGERGFLCRSSDDVRRLLDEVVGVDSAPPAN